MAFNGFDFGFIFRGKDLVSSVTNRVKTSMSKMKEGVIKSQEAMQQSFFGMEVGQNLMRKGMMGLSAVSGLVTKDYSEFQNAMAEVSTLVDTNTVDMSGLEQQVLDLSAAFGQMPVDTAKSLYTTISAGFTDTADAAKILNVSMKLAVGGVTDTNIALDGMTSTLNAWGLNASDAMAVSDAMFVSMRAGKTDVGQLSQNIGQVAAISAKAGVSYTELLAATSALTLGGQSTSSAMTSMRGILAAVIRQAPRATKVAKKLGIAFSAEGIKKAGGLGKWIQDIMVKTKGSDKVISRLFGRVEALTGIFALGGKQAKNFAMIQEQMKKRSGETEKAYKKMSMTMAFQMKKLSAVWKIMKIQIGKALAPVFAIFVKVLTGLLNVFKAIQTRAPIVGKILAGLVGLISGFMVLGGAVLFVTVAAKMLIPIFASMFAAIIPLLPVIGMVVAGIVALVLVGFALKKAYDNNLGGFGDTMRNIGWWIDLVIGSLWEMLTTGKIVGDRVQGVISTGWLLSIVQIVAWVRKGFLDFFRGIKDGFKSVDGIVEPFAILFRSLGKMLDGLSKTWSKLWGVAGGTGGESKGAFTAMMAIKALGFAIGKILGWIVMGIGFVVASVVRLGFTIIEVFVVGLMALTKVFSGVIKIFTGNFKAGIMDIGTGIATFLKGLLSAVATTIHSIVNMFLGMFGQSLMDFEYFKQGFMNGMEAIGNFILSITNAVINWLKPAWSGLGKFIKGIWNSVGNAMSSAGNAIKATWNPIFKWFKEKLKWLIDSLKKITGIGSKIASIVKSPVKIASKIGDVFSGKGESAMDVIAQQAQKQPFTPASPATTEAEIKQSLGNRPSVVNVKTVPKILVESQVELDGETLAEALMGGKNSFNERTLTNTVPVAGN
jgi:TP901 family phage tail tape measure protein